MKTLFWKEQQSNNVFTDLKKKTNFDFINQSMLKFKRKNEKKLNA